MEKLIKISFKNIIYIEGNDNYLKIVTESGSLTSYLTLKELASCLPGDAFVRIHKSFIVHMAMINSIDGNTVLLKDRSTLQIGGNYRDIFFHHVKKKLVKTIRNNTDML